MPIRTTIWLTLFFVLVVFVLGAAPVYAQLPFYTDDPAVTEPGKFHFEFFNEYDALQHQEPNLRQNTANYKFNYGLPHNLEFDIDFPALAIYREADSSSGIGDTDLGLKWNFHKNTPGSKFPALGASFYVEFPTGDEKQQLGSGLHDYWLNLCIQEPLSEKTRANFNIGYLFAGNTSTGVIGVSTTRGHVYTGGISVLHDLNARLTFGAEVYGGYDSNSNLGRKQLQGMLGAQYAIHQGMTFDLGLLGGRYVASPRIGGQVGFSVDFPDVWKRKPMEAGGIK